VGFEGIEEKRLMELISGRTPKTEAEKALIKQIEKIEKKDTLLISHHLDFNSLVILSWKRVDF